MCRTDTHTRLHAKWQDIWHSPMVTRPQTCSDKHLLVAQVALVVTELPVEVV